MSKTGDGPDDPTGLRNRLDSAVVLQATVSQLVKDLNAAGLTTPPVGDGAFESLRAQVLAVLLDRERQGAHAFGMLVNRVDLTERQLQAVLQGGMNDLAAAVILRCLQKVLSRMYHAGAG